MTLEEMGVLLRQERENRGISLEKAAADIKISKKYLIALETGLTDELPHPVYAKGFVKNYARLLGLDPEEMGAILSRHYAVDDDQLKEMPRYEGRDSGPAIKERRAPLVKPGGGGGGAGASILAGAGALAVIGGLVWLLFFSGYVNLDVQQAMTFIKSKLGDSEVTAPAPQAKPAPPTSSVKPETKAEKPATAEAKPEPAPAATAPQAQAEPAPPVQRDLLATGSTQAPPAPASAVKPEPALTPEKLANEAQFAANGKQVVEVNANQPATVEVSTEDGRNRSFTLVKGQRMSLRFNDKIVVRFLQAPSVSVRLNGKDYPLEGGRADGKSITFP